MTKAATDPAPQLEKGDTNIAHRTRNASRRDSSTLKDGSGPKLVDKKEKRQKPKSDYIPPLRRKLGPYETLLQPPFAAIDTIDPVDFELRKFVALVVKSSTNNAGFTEEFVDELADVTACYMNHVMSLLFKYTEVQRHHKPGVSDLQICLDNNNISTKGLYREYLRTKKLPADIQNHSQQLRNRLDRVLLEFNAENYTLEKDDPSLVFHANEQYEIAALVPRQSEPRTYIPSYFPDLPPDFTYQNTGSYMDTITDLKQIKLKLVEESRLNEKSLYKLIEDDDNTWMAKLEQDIHALNSSDLDSDGEDLLSLSGENVSDVETPSGEQDRLIEAGKASGVLEDAKETTETEVDVQPKSELEAKPDEVVAELAELKEDVIEVDRTGNETPSTAKAGARFDFVEYARKRRNAKEREAREIERTRRKRHRNIYMKAEKVFSSYAESAPTLDDIESFDGYLETSFKKVIKAVRIAEKQKTERLAQLQREKVLRQKEQEQKNGSFEFGFAFNAASGILDDSDDDGGDLEDVVFDEQDVHADNNGFDVQPTISTDFNADDFSTNFEVADAMDVTSD